MITGHVIYKNKQPLQWAIDDEDPDLRVGYIFFTLEDAESMLDKIPSLFDFDDTVKLSIREIQLSVR
jgi:hypothetical protein